MYFDDLEIGMTVEIAPAVIKKEKMMDFAREYDNIPLHTDEEYAKATPFGGLIAPGVMSFMSVWARYLEVNFLPLEHIFVTQGHLFAYTTDSCNGKNKKEGVRNHKDVV